MTSLTPAQAQNWGDFFSTLATNDDANNNLVEFSLALISSESRNTRIKNITEENSVILTAGQNGKFQLLHSLIDLGGTRSRRENKVIALIGMGPRAAPVLLDIDSALADCNITTPTLEEIKSCNSVAEFKALEVPEQGPNPTFEGSGSFIPGPFLLTAIIQADSLDPAVLIPLALDAGERFDNEHAEDEGYSEGSATDHVVDFILFGIGVMQGTIRETRFDIRPDDTEMTKWLEERTARCIMPSLLEISQRDSSQQGEPAVLGQLAACIKSMGMGSVHFSSGLTQNLYMGQFAYTFPGAPSNFSVFSVYEGDPMSNDIASRSLGIHLLKSNGVNRNIKDLQDSLKQVLRCPKDFHEMIDQAGYMQGLCQVFFGSGTALAYNWRAFIDKLERNKGSIKALIAGDETLPTKILYAADLRTQRWLLQCEEADDRADVDDELIDFKTIVEDALNHSLRVSLPPVFDVPRLEPKPQQPDLHDNDGVSKRGIKRGRGDSDIDVVTNDQQVPSLKLKQGEKWNSIKSKLPQERPVWDGDGGKRMCLRWHPAGYCFSDCKNKASHVPSSQVPAKKVTEMESFLARARKEGSGRGLAVADHQRNLLLGQVKLALCVLCTLVHVTVWNSFWSFSSRTNK